MLPFAHPKLYIRACSKRIGLATAELQVDKYIVTIPKQKDHISSKHSLYTIFIPLKYNIAAKEIN